MGTYHRRLDFECPEGYRWTETTLSAVLHGILHRQATLHPFFYLLQVADDMHLGFTISALLFYFFSTVFPVEGAGDFDNVDVYGTFTDQETMKMGLTPAGAVEGIEDEKVRSPRVDEVGGDSAKVLALKKWLKG